MATSNELFTSVLVALMVLSAVKSYDDVLVPSTENDFETRKSIIKTIQNLIIQYILPQYRQNWVVQQRTIYDNMLVTLALYYYYRTFNGSTHDFEMPVCQA